jgi:hypothetical protein
VGLREVSLPREAVLVLCRMVGLEPEVDDVEALSRLLEDHMESMRALYEIDTSEVEAAITFHAGWE